MALTKCDECGAVVSSLAKACPKCGAPVATVEMMKTLLDPEKSREFQRHLWATSTVWAILLLVLAAAIFVVAVAWGEIASGTHFMYMTSTELGIYYGAWLVLLLAGIAWYFTFKRRK